MHDVSRFFGLLQPARIMVLAVLLLQLTTLAPLVSLADNGILVIPLKHRLPGELMASLQPLLEPGERVSGHDTQLILQASPQRQPRLLQLIRQMDTTRRNLRISVRQGKDRETTDQQQGVGGVWQQDQTRIVVSNESQPNPGGAMIRRSGVHGHVTLRTNQTATTSRSQSDQSVLVLDGGYATLRVGETLSQVQPYLELARHRLTTLTTARVYDVTAGFDVWPRMQGDQIHQRLNPRLVFRTDQGNQVIQFMELPSEILVKPGKWVDLGGLIELRNDVNRQILSSRGQRVAEDSRLMIRIDPLQAGNL